MKSRSIAFAVAFAAMGAAVPALAVPSFTFESGNRIDNASPESIVDKTSFQRLYYIQDFAVYSASSTDGLSWTPDAGVRVSSESYGAQDVGGSVDIGSVTACSVLPLSGNAVRMVFAASDASTPNRFRIFTASSSDGLAFGVEGIEYQPAAGTYVSSLRMFEDTDGTWRLFFIQGTYLSSSTYRVYYSSSSNSGQSWSTPSAVFDQEAHGAAPAVLTDGRIRLYYLAPLTGQTTATRLLSAIETGAGSTLGFTRESGVRLSTGSDSGTLSAPLVVRDPVEDFRWRAYLSFLSTATSSSPNIVSALTAVPDPQGLSPTTVARTNPAQTFTISGEIFDPAATVKFTKSGETDIPGTSVSAVDDQTLTAVFDTENAALGRWDLVVTNGDLQSATLSSALLVDFEEGRVAELDNVFRPLRGQSVHFDVTVFNDGRLEARVYTIDGRPVRNLFDSDVGIGTTSIDWDGRTDDGNLVASGVYLVSFKGQRLDLRKKVVVIK